MTQEAPTSHAHGALATGDNADDGAGDSVDREASAAGSPGVAAVAEDLPLHPGAAGLSALDAPLVRIGRRARNAFVLALVAPGVVGVMAFVGAGKVAQTGPLLIALIAVLGFLLGMLLVRAVVLRPMARRVQRDASALATQHGIAMDELLSYAARRQGPDWIPRLVAFLTIAPGGGAAAGPGSDANDARSP